MFTCVTGVSGSGKSTLVNEILYKALAQRSAPGDRRRPGDARATSTAWSISTRSIDIDQSPIGRTPRSNPATYTGVFDDIRDLFAATMPEAKVRGYKTGRFSFNVKGGRCEACQGDGIIKIEMHFLPDVYVPCEVCKGKRYNRETLEVSYKGKNIADVLDMTVEEARRVFPEHSAHSPQAADAERRRARLHEAWAAGDDAVGRRGAAGQAGRRAVPPQHGQDAVHSRRADDRAALRTTSSGCSKCCTGWSKRATRCSSSSTTWTSSRRPTRSSTSGRKAGDGGGTITTVGTPEKVAKAEGSYTGRYLAPILERDRARMEDGAAVTQTG